MIHPVQLTSLVSRSTGLAINCLCIWLVLVGCGVIGSVARAQDNFVCGNLYLRVTPDPDRIISAGDNWYFLQVFRYEGDRASPILPSPPFTQAVPVARCVGGSILMFAFIFSSGDPAAVLVFQSGARQLVLLNAADYELQGSVVIIPPRPRLPQSARERIPAEYRSLFDYGER
jgi:hypothetical protein